MVKQATQRRKTFGKKQTRREQLALAQRNINSDEPTQSPLESATPQSPQQEAGPSTSTLPQSTPVSTMDNSDREVVISASKRKLSYLSPEVQASMNETEESEKVLPSTIVDLEILKTLFLGLLCPHCLQPSLALEDNHSKKTGLAISLSVKCNVCNEELTNSYTSKRCDTYFEVNRRAVAASTATGMGYSGLCNFSELMNIPSLHHKTFALHLKSVSTRCEDFSRESLAAAVQKVKDAYPEQDSNIKDIHVSFDGSWHKRGHTSKSGIGLAIERKTGLIVDYEVLTSYCPVCATTGKRLEKQNVLKYERWLASHSLHCSANYEGPSGGMEKEAALRIWSRSIIKNGLRYVSMISDGDAKTITEIQKLDPYPGIRVEKHECVNHVGNGLAKHCAVSSQTSLKKR